MFKSFILFMLIFTSTAAASTDKVSGAIHVGAMLEASRFKESNVISQKVSNLGKGIAFVAIDISEENSDTGENTLEPDSISTNSLILTKKRLVIPYKGSRFTRIFAPEGMDRTHDRIFNVTFVPVLPSKSEGFDSPEFEQVVSGVNVAVGWQKKLIVGKTQPNFNTQVIQSDEMIVIKNRGDSYIRLLDFKFCDDLGNCNGQADQILLSGKEVSYDYESYPHGYFSLSENGKVIKKYSW